MDKILPDLSTERITDNIAVSVPEDLKGKTGLKRVKIEGCIVFNTH